MADKTITAELVRRIFDYDQSAGILRRRVTRGPGRRGDIVGHHTKLGYWDVTFLGRSYKVHRVIWLYVHGAWPVDQIDHINGARNDNRLTNLRACSRAENHQNKAPYRNNSSGYTGVTWHPPNQAWVARIGFDGKKHCLGYHATPEAAYVAYLDGKSRLHKFQPHPRS